MTAKVKLAGAESKKQTLANGKPLAFSKKTQDRIKNICARYPADRTQSAVIPVLKLAQDEFDGWLSTEAMQLVAETLDMPYIRVYEVATFYTMFNLEPVGKYHVQVCTNCACMITGSGEIVDAVKEFTGVNKSGEMSADEVFTFTEVECLGACVESPMMQINNHYYTKLTPEKTKDILTELKSGKKAVHATPTAALKDGY